MLWYAHSSQLDAYYTSEESPLHIEFSELVGAKIPALQGRDEKNNKCVLEILALQGPLIKYDIFKALKPKGVKHYPTISRRVDNLKERGYLSISGKRTTTVGKRKEKSYMYSLTWKGFIASLPIGTVAREVPKVLKNNPLLGIPFPKEIAVKVLSELFTPCEIELVAKALLEGFLRAIPRDIESVEQDKLIAYVLPAMVETPEIRERFEKKDLTKLFQIPGLLDYVLSLINTSEKQFSDLLAGIRTIKKELGRHAQASKKVKKRSSEGR